MNIIAGYACRFWVADHGGDVIVPGAFRRTLQKRGPESVRLLDRHRSDRRVGEWLEIAEDEFGLRVAGRVDQPFADDPRGLSIGFRTIRSQRSRGLRWLTEVDLWEISVVAFPMQPEARFDLVRFPFLLKRNADQSAPDLPSGGEL